jgi:hypothetical protein
MNAFEEVSRWELITHQLANVFEFAFGCHHSKLSRVFTIGGRTYKVCCDCGTNFDYSMQTMSMVPRPQPVPARNFRRPASAGGFPVFRRLRVLGLYRRRLLRVLAS